MAIEKLNLAEGSNQTIEDWANITNEVIEFTNLVSDGLLSNTYATIEYVQDVESKILANTSAITDALQLYQPLSQKGANNGYASLGPDGKIPSSQLSSMITQKVVGLANVTGTAVVGGVTNTTIGVTYKVPVIVYRNGVKLLPDEFTASNGTSIVIKDTVIAKDVFNLVCFETSSIANAVTYSEYNTHTTNVSNPHNTTKAQVGLGNVDNTSDLNKPVSTATKEALNIVSDPASIAGVAPVYDISPIEGLQPTGTTFIRASTATRRNRNGLVESVAPNVLRTSFSPEGRQGWIINANKVNLLRRSQEFNATEWNKGRVTVTPNVITAPDGTLTADLIVETAVNEQHLVFQSPTGTSAVGYIGTLSVFAKAKERNKFYMTAFGEATGYFDLITGTATSNDPTNVKVGIEKYPNGWFRCWATITRKNTSNTNDWYIILADNSGNNPYLGDGTSGLYLWGAQLEQGILTSYIPTLGDVVIRPFEHWTRPLGSDWNVEEGTILIRGRVTAKNSNYPFLWAVDNGDYGERFALFWSPDGNIVGNVVRNSVDQVAISDGPVNDNSDFSVAFSWNSLGSSISVNGRPFTSSGPFSFPVGVTTERFGRAPGGNDWNGLIYSVTRFNRRLPDDVLVKLSSYDSSLAFNAESRKLLDSGANILAPQAIKPITLVTPANGDTNVGLGGNYTFVARAFPGDTTGFYSNYGIAAASRFVRVYEVGGGTPVKTFTATGAGNTVLANFADSGLSTSKTYEFEFGFVDAEGNTIVSPRVTATTAALFKPSIGQSHEGGFLAFENWGDGQLVDLVIAPKSTEVTRSWDTADTRTNNHALSRMNGNLNTTNINTVYNSNTNKTWAAFYARSITIGGVPADLGALDQLRAISARLRPSAAPAGTAFVSGGSEELLGTGNGHWSSTEETNMNAFVTYMNNGNTPNSQSKSIGAFVRPIKSVVVTPPVALGTYLAAQGGWLAAYFTDMSSGTPITYGLFVSDKAVEVSRAWSSVSSAAGQNSRTNGISNDDILWGSNNASAGTQGNINYPASAYCRDLVHGGKNDWYLGAIDEMYAIARTRESLPSGQGLSSGTSTFYWSSTEIDSTQARILVTAGSGAWTGFGGENSTKSTSVLVRPIRRVPLAQLAA